MVSLSGTPMLRLSDICLYPRNCPGICRRCVHNQQHDPSSPRPTLTPRYASSGGGPLSPHPWHVDRHDKAYREPDQAPSERNN